MGVQCLEFCGDADVVVDFVVFFVTIGLMDTESKMSFAARHSLRLSVVKLEVFFGLQPQGCFSCVTPHLAQFRILGTPFLACLTPGEGTRFLATSLSMPSAGYVNICEVSDSHILHRREVPHKTQSRRSNIIFPPCARSRPFSSLG